MKTILLLGGYGFIGTNIIKCVFNPIPNLFINSFLANINSNIQIIVTNPHANMFLINKYLLPINSLNAFFSPYFFL